MAVLSKLLKTAAKVGKDVVDETIEKVDEAKNLLTDPKKIDDWKKQNPNPKPQKRNPDVEKAANDLLDGEITGKQYRSIVKENTPIKKIEEVPSISTFKEIVGSLNKDKSSKGILGLTKNIEDGTRVSSRLDIPAYEKHDVWVVSLHDALDKKGRVDSLQGDILGYGKTAVLKNVEFKTLPQGASKIAAGRADKGTIARIFGDYYNENPATTKAKAEQVLNDPEWTQVGFNPFKHGYFYDKDTSMPIKSADEVLQVGALVLAKNAQKFNLSEAKKLGTQGGLKIRTEGKTETIFSKGGTTMKKQMKLFNEGGLEQDGGAVDPVSGNDVPIGSSKEEVRDDIDAKLSEGEFVFPADVVRFIGLEKLMMIRQEAKAGLKKMEAMGQMGNSEEATIPDDIPFNSADIMVEDDDGNEGELEMNTGGVVYRPSQVGSQFNIAPQQQQMYQPPQFGIPQPMYPPQQTGYVPSFGMQQQPQQYTGFQSLIPMPTQQYNNVSYINKTTGETMVIPHVGGNPVFNPPEGYTPIEAGQEAPKEEAKVDETLDTSVSTATVTQPKDDPDRMLVGDKFLTREQREKIEDQENMNKSYDAMVKQMMDNNPGIGMNEIKDKIKAGEGTIKVFGKEIKAPGFLFTEQGISDAYYRAYDDEMDATETDAAGKTTGVKIGTKIKTDNKGKIAEGEVASAAKPKIISFIDEGTAGEREVQILKEKQDIEAIQATAREKIKREAIEKAEAEGQDMLQAEREANRAMAQQEKLDDYTSSKIAEQRTTGRIRGFNKGGIASKTKKKTMKQGGLASKK